MTMGLTTSSWVRGDPADANVFLAAARWIETVLMGPLATSLAVVAVASIGLLMLSGRVNVRRGAVVIIGCFILFGAASIAQGLRGVTTSFAGAPALQPVPAPPALPVELLSPPVADPPVSADPYAGASIRR